MTRRRHRERGSALLVTLVLIGALLAGSAVLVMLQMTSNRATDMTRNGMSSLYCAEAGLAAARGTVAANYPLWNAALAFQVANPGVEPPFLNSVNHLIGADVTPDYVLTIADNQDETPPANNPSVDNDLRIFLISTCIKFPDNPKQVEELIQFNGGGNCYNAQAGGCGGNGNNN